MSYEGYVQYLCARGHNWNLDCYDEDTDNPICPECSERAVWRNSVDLTNGSFEGDQNSRRIDGYIQLTPKTAKTCKECHSVLERTYEIPTVGGERL